MSIIKSLIEQAKEQRAILESPEHDAVAAEIARLEPRCREACVYPAGSIAQPMPEAERLLAVLNDHNARLQRLAGGREDATNRLKELDRMIFAGERADAAAVALRQARAAIAAVETKQHQATEAIERMRGLQAEESAAAVTARARIASEALAGLPEDVRELIGASAATGDATPGDAAVRHEHRATAIGEAIARVEQALQQLARDLTDAKAAESEAGADLLAQRAYQAEVEHAEALAAYLQVLGRYRGAHSAAFDWAPRLPNYKQLTDATLADQTRDARRALDVDADVGVVRRGLRKLSAALS